MTSIETPELIRILDDLFQLKIKRVFEIIAILEETESSRPFQEMLMSLKVGVEDVSFSGEMLREQILKNTQRNRWIEES